MAVKPKKRVTARKNVNLVGWCFIAPFMCIWLVLLVYPLIKGIWISLNDWDIVIGKLSKHFHFFNYVDIFSDAQFWVALKNTVVFVSFTVVSVTALSLILAVSLNRVGRIYSFLRSIFFISSILSVTVVTLIWLMILNSDYHRGLLAGLFHLFGLNSIDWFSNSYMAMTAMVITTIWWGLGLPFLLFLTGLQQLPKDVNDAARIDGVSGWRKLIFVTLPQLKRTVLLVLITQVVMHFQVFGQSYLMTKGGPAGSTRTLVQYIYEQGISQPEMMGYGSAVAMILLLIMVIASFIQLIISKERS